MVPDGGPESPAHFEPPLAAAHRQPTLADRAVALLEVVICSDYPTQVALGSVFTAFGYGPRLDGHLSVGYVVMLSLLDTLLLLALILAFLSAHRESPREV